MRFRFLLLGVALLVPIALLVDRALQSVSFERRARHDVIAERVFDEMERELSRLLEREEARPFGEYAFRHAPDSGAGRRRAPGVSPLAPLPEPDWLLGYFQINPDGSFQTPHEPLDVGRAAREDGWKQTPELSEAVATLQRVAATAWRDPEGRLEPAEAFEASEPDAQLAGTTVELRPKRALLKSKAVEPEVQKKEYSAYDALSSLNRGAQLRQERKVRVSEEVVNGGFAADADADANADEQAEAEPRAEAEPEQAEADRLGRRRELDDRPGEAFGLPSSAAPALRAPEAPPQRASGATPKRDAPATSSTASSKKSDASSVQAFARGRGRGRARASSPDEKRNVPAPGKASFHQAGTVGRKTVRVTLAPMTGRAIDAQHLILYRTVLRGSRGYRQGLVLDTARLGDWLRATAIGSSGLEGLATLRFDSVFEPESAAESRAEFAYRRRFAEPFADLGATLELQALPGLGGGSYVMTLSLLLVAAGALGLIALYRMVSVALRFAERRSNFAAAVSHELKTPLTAIRMYAEMLRDGMVDSEEKRHEYYEAMTNEAERLSRLIHNVLEFSQLEKGQRELTPQVGSLEPVLRETERLLRAHVEREGFALHVEVAPGLPAVRFDHDALLQVLFNLVDNSIKYAAASQDRRISLCCEPDGDGVRVSVRDFGPGVASRQLQRVFEPFYREEAELTRRTKGTGIGLALVRGLVDAMGGDVSAENAEPTGLRVRIRLRPASA